MRENSFPDSFFSDQPEWARHGETQYPIVRHRRRMNWRALRNAGLALVVGVIAAVLSVTLGLAFGMDLI